ncbi:MAG: sigma-70 family RNA polymerase sigma factor [Planctomycetes bacterium]|nr:sigma-70 family RNA polymerase sigma factor [Planctomycetota bacterium]
MSQSDAELLETYADRRDEEAFGLLVRRHGALVRRVARRILHDDDLAEDAAQAAFLVLARRARALGREAKVIAFLVGVARRTALEILRTRRRSAARERSAIMARAEEVDHAQVVETGDLMLQLDRVLASLPADLRAAVVLRHLEGLDQAEAARVAGCPQGTLAWRTRRGLELLRRRLRRDDPRLAAIAVVDLLELERAAIAAEPPLVSPLGRDLGPELGRLIDRIARQLGRRALIGRLTIALVLLLVLAGLATAVLRVLPGDLDRPRPEPASISFRPPTTAIALDWKAEPITAADLPAPFRRLQRGWRGRAESCVLPSGTPLRAVAPGRVLVAVELRAGPGSLPWSLIALEHRSAPEAGALATSLMIFRGSLAAGLAVGDQVGAETIGSALAGIEAGDQASRLLLVLHEGPWRQVSPRFLAEARREAIGLARLAGRDLPDDAEVDHDWAGEETLRLSVDGEEIVQVAIAQRFSADPVAMPALPVWCFGDDPDDLAWRRPSAWIAEEDSR